MDRLTHNPIEHHDVLEQSVLPQWYAGLVGGMINRAKSYERPHQNLTMMEKMRRLYGDEQVEEMVVLYNVLR